MPSFIDLLLAYGLCFGLMNKVDALRSEKWPLGAFFNRMLSCSIYDINTASDAVF